MLSGFGIYLSPKRPEKSYKSKIEFVKNKIKKIYPAYIVSLVVMLPCTYIELRPYGSAINAGLKSLTLLGADASLFQSVTGMTFFSHKWRMLVLVLHICVLHRYGICDQKNR